MYNRRTTPAQTYLLVDKILDFTIEWAVMLIEQRLPSNDELAENAVVTRGLSKTYGVGDAAVKALDDVTIRLPRGKMTAVIGASGSGKSTFLHCVAGLDDADSGDSWVDGVHVQSLTNKTRPAFRRDKIGFVFQQKGLVPVLTARENIVLPYSLEGREPDWTRFDKIITSLGLADRLEHMPDQLSGGQRQKTALARILLQRPQVMFADEPTGALDVESSSIVLDLLRNELVNEMGVTVIMVTHSVKAAVLADEVVSLSDGKITSVMDSPTAGEIEEALTLASDGKR